MRSRLLAGWLVVFALLTGVAISAPAAGPTLTVSAAASLTAPLRELKGMFLRDNPTVEVALNLAASGVLEAQIEQGAPADIFISAGQAQMKSLIARGLVDSAAVNILARNQLVLIVPASAHPLHSLDDLALPGIDHIAIGSAKTVPAGQYAMQALRHVNLADRIREKLVPGEDVKQVLEYVATGAADAGFVYVTDARGNDRVKIAFAIPDSTHDLIVYPMALIARSANPDLARRFLNLCLSPDGQAVMAKNGFLRPPDRSDTTESK